VEFSGSTTKSGGLTVDGPKEIRAYLNIYPGLSYDLTDNLSFQTSLNFLSLGYSYFVSRDGSFKDVTSSFNFGTGLSNILSIGSITIGAIYKF
jgi:opacity protein-like surface antigen